MYNKIFYGILLGTIIVFLAALFALLTQVFGVFGENRATIIGGILSMIGGFAGAMGAYMAARHQSKQEKSKDKINLLSYELPIYTGLSLELERIIEQFKKNTDFIEQYKVWIYFPDILKQNNIIKFNAVKWSRWVEVNKITDSILSKELLKFEDTLQRIVVVFEYDIKMQEQLFRDFAISNSETERRKSLILKEEINNILGEKQQYLEDMGTYLNKAESLQKVILNKISSIESLIEGRSSINDFRFFSSQDDFELTNE